MDRYIDDTKLPYLIVDKKDLGSKYPIIGTGTEGIVYKYNQEFAIKTFSLFRAIEFFYGKELDHKFAKLEYMASLEDESFCFPIGLVGFETLYKEGCYMKLVDVLEERKDFNSLKILQDKKEIIDLLIKADTAMERIHKLGVVIGDIRENNILIDKLGNPIFIDTDNYATDKFDFDLLPYMSEWLNRLYNKKYSRIDNDIFSFTIMVLKILSNIKIDFSMNSIEIMDIVKNLELSREVKEGIECIVSDSVNKPYVGPILRKIK